jgi:hypothetical protein
MQEVIAKCGNRCDLCPLYRDHFDLIGPEEINGRLYKYHHGGRGTPPQYTRGCDGCMSEGFVVREGCPIRECVDGRGLRTCADCERLFCALLEADMGVVEGALARHAGRIPQEDYDRYFRPFLIRSMLSRLRSERGGGTASASDRPH